MPDKFEIPKGSVTQFASVMGFGLAITGYNLLADAKPATVQSSVTNAPNNPQFTV